MFLIEFAKGSFINGEEIQWIMIRNGLVKFTVKGDAEDAFEVDPEYQMNFVNNLQHLNQNIHNIEKRYSEISL